MNNKIDAGNRPNMGLFTTTTAAEWLQVSPSQVRRFINRGHLRATKVGRDWVIAVADLKTFAEHNRQVLVELPPAEESISDSGDYAEPVLFGGEPDPVRSTQWLGIGNAIIAGLSFVLTAFSAAIDPESDWRQLSFSIPTALAGAAAILAALSAWERPSSAVRAFAIRRLLAGFRAHVGTPQVTLILCLALTGATIATGFDMWLGAAKQRASAKELAATKRCASGNPGSPRDITSIRNAPRGLLDNDLVVPILSREDQPRHSAPPSPQVMVSLWDAIDIAFACQEMGDRIHLFSQFSDSFIRRHRDEPIFSLETNDTDGDNSATLLPVRSTLVALRGAAWLSSGGIFVVATILSDDRSPQAFFFWFVFERSQWRIDEFHEAITLGSAESKPEASGLVVLPHSTP